MFMISSKLNCLPKAPNGVTNAKLHNTKLRLNYSIASPRNGMLNQLIRNYLISTNFGKLPDDLCHSLKEINLAITNPIFWPSVPVPCSCSFLVIKIFHFGQL